MTIAVLSGKGGTGKTLVSANLAAVAGDCVYVDCDVEEPNGHLFFKPVDIRTEDITVKIPEVDEKRCIGCRKCVDFCKFNALAFIKNKPYVFEEVCHSCGGCILLCPQNALSEKEKSIGEIQEGKSEQVSVKTGILNAGESSGIPIIKRLLSRTTAEKNQLTFIDCPPGSACIVMESIKDADYCVLVAEPTVFGVHNLHMVYTLVQLFKKPFGVVLNKCLEGENPAEVFCLEKGMRILGKLFFDSLLGTLNSNAVLAARVNAQYHTIFAELLETVMREAHDETAVNP